MKEAKQENVPYDPSYIKFRSKENQAVVLESRPVFTWGRRQGVDTGRSQALWGDGDIPFLDLSKYWSHSYVRIVIFIKLYT